MRAQQAVVSNVNSGFIAAKEIKRLVCAAAGYLVVEACLSAVSEQLLP